MKKIFIFAVLLFVLTCSPAFASNHNLIKKGKMIFFRSGCLKCHSLIKNDNINGIDSLNGFGGRGLSVKEAEEAIRSCKMDTVCSQVLTNKQVEAVAYFLNSLKSK